MIYFVSGSLPYPLRCTIDTMKVKIPPEVQSAMIEISRQYGRMGGKKAAKQMTPEERSARAKKASLAAAKKRTAKRLAAETARGKQPKKPTKKK